MIYKRTPSFLLDHPSGDEASQRMTDDGDTLLILSKAKFSKCCLKHFGSLIERCIEALIIIDEDEIIPLQIGCRQVVMYGIDHRQSITCHTMKDQQYFLCLADLDSNTFALQTNSAVIQLLDIPELIDILLSQGNFTQCHFQ